jgi:hypothetical protein
MTLIVQELVIENKCKGTIQEAYCGGVAGKDLGGESIHVL